MSAALAALPNVHLLRHAANLGKGQARMGGSILAQTLELEDGAVPDLDDPQDLVNLVKAINALRAQGQVLAYHDRSDGGLLATVCEMAFAGHMGVSLNIDMLLVEGDGISDSRMDTGDSKNWASQVGARREDGGGRGERAGVRGRAGGSRAVGAAPGKAVNACG